MADFTVANSRPRHAASTVESLGRGGSDVGHTRVGRLVLSGA